MGPQMGKQGNQASRDQTPGQEDVVHWGWINGVLKMMVVSRALHVSAGLVGRVKHSLVHPACKAGSRPVLGGSLQRKARLNELQSRKPQNNFGLFPDQ